MTIVTLPWDRGSKEFELDKLETVWLLWDNMDRTDSIMLMRMLTKSYRWPSAEASEYVVAIVNDKWAPV